MRTGLRYPSRTYRSGREKAAPFGKSDGAGVLVGVAVLEVALRRKVVVDLTPVISAFLMALSEAST
jgi:hypothetical protein